jgi:uncharacterized protein (DUF305 family)
MTIHFLSFPRLRPRSQRRAVRGALAPAAVALVVSVLLAPGALGAQSGPPTAAIPAGARYTAADVAFMYGMIGHHAQALEMSALVSGRSTNPQLALLAERIIVSQRDEIDMMRRWLLERGQPAPPSVDSTHAAHDPHAAHDQQAGHVMPGMLTSAQRDTLRAARGTTFDSLFLRYMIQHHDGAVVMVAELLRTPGAAREPMVFQFVSDVDTDQRAEIRRMQAMLKTLP